LELNLIIIIIINVTTIYIKSESISEIPPNTIWLKRVILNSDLIIYKFNCNFTIFITYSTGYSEAAVSTSSTTLSISRAFRVGNGRTKPNNSRIGLSFPSKLITKDPLLGFSSLIFTVNEFSVLASRAAFTRLALVLNAFHDLQCSIVTTTESFLPTEPLLLFPPTEGEGLLLFAGTGASVFCTFVVVFITFFALTSTASGGASGAKASAVLLLLRVMRVLVLVLVDILILMWHKYKEERKHFD
jgi:hypothetical protein